MINKNFELILELTKKEFYERYKGTFGGIIWSFIQPLFLLTIYTIAFGIILKAKWSFATNTSDYALMIFAGLLIFNGFAEVMNKSAIIIKANPNFVKKILFPIEILSIVIVLCAFINIFISIIIWIFVFYFFYGYIHITVLYIPFIMIIFVPLLIGLSWIISSVGLIIKDMPHIIGILNHSLLFLTPIFYSLDVAPSIIHNVLIFNPLTFIIETLRSVLYYGILPQHKSLLIYFFISIVFSTFSFYIFKKIRPRFSDLL